MLSDLAPAEPDGILGLMRAFAEDPRPGKIDLGVGVYRAENGETPVMAAVKTAERRLLEEERTKSYVGLLGDPAFLDAVRALTLGDAAAPGRVAGAATTGGTAAVRHAFDLFRAASPTGTVWISRPTWPNHPAILRTAGHRFDWYRHAAGGAPDRSGLWEDLGRVQPGDALVLHGCCHNPTGVDLGPDDWAGIARLCAAQGILPIVDLAYQGFGDGVERDVEGLRTLAAAVPEMLLCVSGSKNFGLYRDRAGALLVVTPDAASAARVTGQLAGLNRMSCSFPPDHGARLVTMVLGDPSLRAEWQAELDTMRARIRRMRADLAAALQAETGSDRFASLATHRGLFSLLPATPSQMEALRRDHAVYAVADGRINLAGLTPATVAPAARAIAAVLG